jgi:hypothetical protein
MTRGRASASARREGCQLSSRRKTIEGMLHLVDRHGLNHKYVDESARAEVRDLISDVLLEPDGIMKANRERAPVELDGDDEIALRRDLPRVVLEIDRQMNLWCLDRPWPFNLCMQSGTENP